MKNLDLYLNSFLDVFTDSCILHNDDTMSKNINGKIIRKKCVRRKDLSYDWVEYVKKEDIDTEYFNLDYTRKNPQIKEGFNY